ncbi:hypothetical protein Bpfe_015420 [Biomphalaria pfeifferi]|uniref:VWFD domain-containing protein n=1 Tax=Biomphalaria pfeifferi TaxID=112525 RepID=A0AAD8F9M0_BIOPF|nr:hypothetical protein Bpfe_015420 [Biomphalaria pfeifferi]
MARKMSARLLNVVVLFVLVGQVCYAEEVCHPHYCISGRAQCFYNSTCECNNPPYSWGHGDFACYQSNQWAAELKNDPVLTTFNNESVKFHDPCRFLFTSVKLELKQRTGVMIGFCYFNVHAFNRRIKGKIVVDGIEIAAKFELGYQNIKTLSIVTYGQAGNVTLGGTDDIFSDGGHYKHELSHGPVIYSDPAHNIYVKRFYNPDNRQYVFEVENCGFRATFVPYDVELGIRSPFIPGLSLAVNHIYHPQWLQTDKVIALPPSRHGSPTIESIAHHHDLSKEHAAVFRSLTRHVKQNQPGACKICSEFPYYFDKCNSTELTLAFQKCFWILDTPRFIKCISPDYPDTTSYTHLSFFAACIDHFCDDYQRCDDLRGNACHWPQLDHIIYETCQSY